MRWFRQEVRWGAWLALFALAVHMFVSFVHVHADGDVSSVPGMSAAADQTKPPPPAHPYRNSAARDFCAICANINLLGSLNLPVPSAPAALRDFDRIRYRHRSVAEVRSQTRSAF